jgi:hypothetical protein
MRGSLGEKIGEGGSADIHAWAPGQVVKLFRAGVRRRVGEYEARVTRAAFAAGVPAPAVLDEVTLEGRFGIVLSRLDGPTLVQLLRTGAMTPDQAGAILASLPISSQDPACLLHDAGNHRAIERRIEGASPKEQDRIACQLLLQTVVFDVEDLEQGFAVCRHA